MRITNSMMVSQFLSDANTSLSRVSKYQNQVDSTKKITRISDDPQATITALKARNKLSNLALYQSNISTASSYLTEAESATGELNTILQTAYEEIVSASSGAKTQDELDVIATEIKNLKDEVLSIANTSMGTSYIFGGYNFTGSTDGVTKIAPFSVEETTGDLIYNGINLSKYSWKDEFDTNASLMSGFGDGILMTATDLGMTSSDLYARDTLCADAAKSLENLVSCGEASLKAAIEFGVDESDPAYQALDQMVRDLSDISKNLNGEISKKLTGDYILDSDPAIALDSDGNIDYNFYEEQGITVMTADELANCYSIADSQAILGQATLLLDQQYDAFGNPLGSLLNQAITGLSGEIVVPSAVMTEVALEADKQSELQIGTTQKVEFTLTGLDLLGLGSDNIYHILDKCSKMLSGEMNSKGLSGMITSLQDAQSDVLNLQTKIGSTQNRLTLINSRYDSTEINYTEMKSDAEDVDMAEAITNFTTAKTVYSAALAAGAEIIQTSLLDYIR